MFIQPIWYNMYGKNISVLINLIGDNLSSYNNFRLSLKTDNPDWKYICINKSSPHHTNVCNFYNLEENKRYIVIGQYYQNKKWVDIDELIIPCCGIPKAQELMKFIDFQTERDSSNEHLNISLDTPPVAIKKYGQNGGGDGGNTNPNNPPKIDSQYIIPIRPTQQTQNVYSASKKFEREVGTCVANSIASAKEIQEQRQNKRFLKYSVGWFFGKFGESETLGTNYNTALNGLINHGIPPYEVVKRINNKDFYPDCETFTDSKTVVNMTGSIPNYTLPQKISKYKEFIANETEDNKVVEEICNAIKNNGDGFNTTVLCAINIDSSFDRASRERTGLVGNLEGNYRGGHMMIIIGWATINNKKYWIMQNSWTTYGNLSDIKPLGDNGLMYVPFDWYIIQDGKINGLQLFYILYDDINAPELPYINPIGNTYLTLNGSDNPKNLSCDYVKWEIKNLRGLFNSENYIKAGISTSPITDTLTTVTGIIDEVKATPNGNNNYAYNTWNGVEPNSTYTVWGFVQYKDGKYYPVNKGNPITFQTRTR